METEEYRKLWKEAIHLCEIEPSEEEATSFVRQYYNKDNSAFGKMDDRTLLLTFMRFVVYEKKCHLKYDCPTPSVFCYQDLLKRALDGRMDRAIISEVGEWAAEYSANGKVPIGNYHGYVLKRVAKSLLRHEMLLVPKSVGSQEKYDSDLDNIEKSKTLL